MAKKTSLADALRKEQEEQRPARAAAAPQGQGDKRRLVNFRLEPAVIYQLKTLALNEGKSAQALLCEGLNKIFIERNLPPIAK